MKKKILTLAVLTALGAWGLQAQEEVQKDSITLLQEQIDNNKDGIKGLKKLKVSGYIQSEMEISGKDGKTKTGANQSWSEATDGDKDSFMRYGLRRSRIKFQYSEKIAKGVFEMDISEGGIKPKNAFLQLDPAKWLSLQAGLVTLWFGNEVGYSSSELEVLERSRHMQDLFPDEKDLALRMKFKGIKNTTLDGLTLDLGLLSGNAVNKTPDGRVNFLGKLSYSKSTSDLDYGVGLSYYYGKTNNAGNIWYEINNNSWVADSVAANKKKTRQYFGIDARVCFETMMGLTNIQSEYTIGTQPSQKGSLKSPNNNTYDATNAFCYNRKFQGFYIYLIQDIYSTPISAICKWAYTDNNREISGNDITNKGDLAYNDFALGLMYRINPNLRLTGLFDIVKNEKTNKISGYDKDLKDNIFTLRLQYKF